MYVCMYNIQYIHKIVPAYVCTYLTAIIADVADDFISPLLRSAVPSDEITAEFDASVDATLQDIINTLNGSNVNLTRTLFNYFLAVSTVYFNEALDAVNSIPFVNLNLDISQVQCGVRAVFNHIYTNVDAAAEMIELIQNISQAIRIIKQVYTHVATYILHFLKLMSVKSINR